MDYKVFKDRIEINGKEDFDIEHILECGQVFSFVKTDHYTCYSADKKAEIFEDKKGFEIVTNNPVYFEKYFDLKTDYSQIKKQLSKYEILKKPIKFGHGIRILRQNLFEAINSTNRRDIWINNQGASQPGAILNIIFSFDFFL